VERMKAEKCKETAHFDTMLGARITFRQSTAIERIRSLHPSV